SAMSAFEENILSKISRLSNIDLQLFAQTVSFVGPDRCRSLDMRDTGSGDCIRPLCFALPKGEVHTGSFVDGDHEVVRRDLGFRGDPSVDVLQERQPGLRRP